ncbi:metallophosphoesterase family protein [Actinoplanes sp. NPDC051411]|uniref:metallophosphoesterase family protein n=1 Tax=Actinoplanes sp. NPDC051411 TaxID=3155522 RepID=UPI0034397383
MGRTVVVGDIHGCFDELTELLASLDLRPSDLLVAAGDVVDRGPAPGEVVRFLRERPNTVVLMGNHERKHVRGIFSYAQEITRLQLGPRYGEVVDWMRTLPYHFENEHVRVVHAAMLSGIPLAAQKEEILCGSTSGEKELAALFPQAHWQEHYTDAKPVAVGHHVVGPPPVVLDGRVFSLDTGACHGGALSALSVPDFTLHSVAAHADYWAAAKREWQLPVLKSKPWLDYPWSELAAAVARFSRDPASEAWLRAVERWAAELRALPLVPAAYRLAAELDAGRWAGHPAARFLFQTRDGRLTEETMGRQCPAPRRTIEVAEMLGVPYPAFGTVMPSPSAGRDI